MVSRTKERALDPLVGACATRPGHAVNMLTDERRSARHPGDRYPLRLVLRPYSLSSVA